MAFRTMVAGAILFASTAVAHAASISVMSFSAASYQASIGTFGPTTVENFESFIEGNVADGFSTAVGTFKTVGGIGSASTVTDSTAKGNFAGNDGSKLAVRDGNVYGRSSTTADLTGDATKDKFLDSNDTHGIEWTVSIGSQFNRILLTLSDAADSPSALQITAAGMTKTLSGLGNGNTQMVLIDFGGNVSGATVLFEVLGSNGYKRNDGFSLDDIAVAAIPLPASALLLLGGLGAIGAYGRRRRAA